MFKQITLNDIDQEWAWSQLVGKLITVGKTNKYCSPLRVDSKPGVWFEYYGDILLIIDFGDRKNSHINCVTAWSRLKGIHWKKALREIYEGQGIYVVKKRDKVKKVEKIITIAETWTQQHKDFWTIRGGKPSFVKGVAGFTIHGEKTRYTSVDELCFGYKYAEGKYKLYFPDRTKDQQRFISNLAVSDVFLNYIDETLLIGKAQKDYAELLKVWDHSLTHVQCENCWREMVDQWKVFEKKYIFFDNDRAGLKNALELAQEIDGKILFIPTVDSLSFLPDGIYSYLVPSLQKVVDCFNTQDCVPVGQYMLTDFIGKKDYDDLVISELNNKRIFKWLVN